LKSQLGNIANDAEASKASLTSKFKNLQEEHASVCYSLEESQDATDSLQNQLNIATEEKKDVSMHLEKVHNQLNDILSDHEGCSATIASLENHCSSLQKQLIENDDLVESLKEEQNVIVESNIEVVREKDLEIERLTDMCQNEKVAAEQKLDENKLVLQSIEEEKSKLELHISEKDAEIHDLKNELEEVSKTLTFSKAELEKDATVLEDTIASLKTRLKHNF
jgi:chromosome segregation ATPase